MDMAAPGSVPVVTVLDTGQFRWHQQEAVLHVSTDLDELLGRLSPLESDAVVDFECKVKPR